MPAHKRPLRPAWPPLLPLTAFLKTTHPNRLTVDIALYVLSGHRSSHYFFENTEASRGDWAFQQHDVQWYNRDPFAAQCTVCNSDTGIKVLKNMTCGSQELSLDTALPWVLVSISSQAGCTPDEQLLKIWTDSDSFGFYFVDHFLMFSCSKNSTACQCGFLNVWDDHSVNLSGEQSRNRKQWKHSKTISLMKVLADFTKCMLHCVDRSLNYAVFKKLQFFLLGFALGCRGDK